MGRLRDGEWIAGAGGRRAAGGDVPALVRRRAVRGAPPGRRSTCSTSCSPCWRSCRWRLVVTQATRASPSIPVAFSVFTVLAGALAALLILYRIVNQPGPNDVVEVELGAWLGLLAALVIAGGGWRSMRVEPIPGAPLPPVEDLPAPAP